jgi:hypothetical protein
MKTVAAASLALAAGIGLPAQPSVGRNPVGCASSCPKSLCHPRSHVRLHLP